MLRYPGVVPYEHSSVGRPCAGRAFVSVSVYMLAQMSVPQGPVGWAGCAVIMA